MSRIPFALPSFLLAALLFGLGCAGGSRTTDASMEPTEPYVALIDGTPITLAEFEAQFLRTTVDTLAAANDSLAAYEDFLNRYVDFRLKVLEAVEAGYADQESLKAELRQYRSQLARPYLMEQAVVEPLIRDLYAKKQELVDVSHILIRVPENAPPTDTLRAYNQLAGLIDSLSTVDFGDLAARHSQDPSAQNQQGAGYRGRLGYFSGGRMVKPFEDRMYATAIGEVSEIFRTRFGFHVLKVNDRIPARPEIRIAHIMVQVRGQAAADSAVAMARVDSAYSRLRSGEAFESIAADLSDDRNSAQRGGDLDFVAFDGWLPVTMRDVAFDLDGVGSISEPVETQFGYHIVKLLERRDQPSLEESYEDLKGEIARLPRSDEAERSYARALRDSLGATVDSSWVYEKLGTASVDSVLFSLSQATLPEDEAARVIVTIGDDAFSVRDLGVFAAGHQPPTGVAGSDRLWNVVAAFLDEQSIASEVSRLEDRDASFRRTMQEFRDGLMLFRLMEDSVWTAAAVDSAALQAYFDANASSYRFGDRTRILGVASSSDSLVQSIAGRLDAGEAYAAIAAEYASDSTGTVRFDTTFVEGETSSIYDRALSLEEGNRTGVLSYSAGRIVLVNDGLEPARPKTFQEARAEVITAYQTVVEERLIARLRQEHDVRLFPEVLTQAFAGYRQ